ncbi:MAG: anti sigma factor C-terminal domain-containing protein [Actinomycetota bacterium]|nr:anti sigma factor C-terminal domain-containing protein [Actinomycetota bacterium]
MSGEEQYGGAQATEETVDFTPLLDEAAFIKAAKRRSTRRMVFVSGGLLLAVLGMIAVLVVGWHLAIYKQADRIDSYYPALVGITSPNTELIQPGELDVRFPGASRRYTAYRRVGDVAIAAGEAFAEFDVWGGETAQDPVRQQVREASRVFSGSSVTPQLDFLEPAGTRTPDPDTKAAEPEILAGMAARTATALSRLASAPPSSTVELAVSFRSTLTLEDVERRLGSDLDLVWGAVVANDAAGIVWDKTPGTLVGVDFDTSAGDEPSDANWRRERESRLPRDLRMIADMAPGGTAQRCRRSASYLEEHGVRYYGIVVCGSPEAALALVGRPDVSAVSLGVVVMPWE